MLSCGMQKTKHAELSAHIARVEGQLAAVRTALAADDCSKAARTLLAASRSLQSARASCVEGFLSERIFRGAKASDDALLADVHALMKA